MVKGLDCLLVAPRQAAQSSAGMDHDQRYPSNARRPWSSVRLRFDQGCFMLKPPSMQGCVPCYLGRAHHLARTPSCETVSPAKSRQRVSICDSNHRECQGTHMLSDCGQSDT